VTLTQGAGVRRPATPHRSRWRLVLVTGVVAALGVLVAVVIGVRAIDGGRATPAASTRGSGALVAENREVAPFTSVELAGANTVVIRVGAPLSVTVSGDDNLVGRITTVVRGGRLVIDNTGSFTTKAPMRVEVSAPSLDGVVLGGDGTVTVDGVTGTGFNVELAGHGTLVVSGTVQRVTAVLAGAGTLDLHGVVATDGIVQLRGTGTIRVHATATLDAALTGTGTILYSGAPTVTVRNTGTGTVVPG
jgi:Putative auto-transporter adhesin, head GIN domain